MSKLGRRKWEVGTPLGILLGCGLLTGFRPPVPGSDCKQQVVAAYHHLLGVDQANSKRVYHLRFSSTSRYKSPGQRTLREATVHGDMYYQGRVCSFQTEQVRLWQDERYVATVLPAQRIVLVTRVPPQQHGLEAARLLGLRDSLLLLGSLQQCGPEQHSNQVLRRIRLAYDGKAGSKLRFKSVDFWLTGAQKLQQVRVAYRPGGTVQETTFRFSVPEWLTSCAELPVDARQKVLTPQGRLLPEFEGYRLINQIPAGH